MKILVSAKALARALNSLNEQVDSILTKGYGDNTEVQFCAGEHYSALHCVCKDPALFIDQSDRRWDWIKELVNKVEDQPLVLEISETCVNVIFQY